MRKGSFIKRGMAVLLAAVISFSSTPYNTIFADEENQIINTESEISGVEDKQENPVLSFSESNGEEFDLSGIVLYSVNGKKKTKIDTVADDLSGTIEIPEIYIGTSISYEITPSSDSGLVKYSGVIEKLDGGESDIEFAFSYKYLPGIDVTEIRLEYGGDGYSTDDIETALGYDGSIDFGAIEADGIYKISDGIIKPLRPGTGVIKISASETENWESEETIVPVIVEKKNLGEISSAGISWSGTSKTYDADNSFAVSGKLNAETGVINGDEVTFKADIIAENSDVGKWKSTISKYTVQKGGDLYSFSLSSNENAGPSVEITKADAEVSVDNRTVTYGDSDWNSLVNGTVPNGWESQSIHTECIIGNDAMEQALDEISPESTVNITIKNDSFVPGTVKDAMKLSVSDPKNSNFHFLSAGNGNITVLNAVEGDREIWDQISPDESNLQNAYVDENTIWSAPGGRIPFTLKDTTLYNKILFEINGNKYENEINVPQDADGTLSGKVQLGNTESESILSDADSSEDGAQPNDIPENAIRIDKTSPEVVFGDNLGTYTVADAPDFGDLAMVKFQKTGYKGNVTVQDSESGVQEKKYRLLKINGQSDAEEKIRASAGEYDLWENVPEDGEIEVPGTETGYWLILVGVKDNVGNASVYSSNGIVIDTTEPYVTITGIDENTVYNGDVTFTVRSGEAGDPSISGIRKMTVTAKSGSNERIIYDWNAEDSDPAITDLTANEPVEASVTVPSGTFNGNAVEITAETEDRSGNIQKATRVIKIDTSEPSIHVQYDNNNPVNGKYFNSARTMTVTYCDRNFNPEDAGFIISINGEERIVNAGDLSGYGITTVSERVDSEAGVDPSMYTDNRTNTYIYRFGETGDIDADYKIVPFMKDSAGNECTDIDYGGSNPQTEFTIDEIAPTINAVFTDTDGGTITPSESDLNKVYSLRPVIGKYTVNERNFSEDGLQVDVAGKDIKGSGVAVPNSGTWNEKVYTTSAYDSDANYEISMEYTDLAGNKATAGKYFFTVDAKAPTGKLITVYNGQQKESEKLSEKIRFGTFSNEKVTFLHSENDNTSDVAYVMYAIHVPDKEARGEFDIPSLNELETMTWKSWDDSVAVSPDSQAVVFMKVADKAGNIAYISSKDGIIAETTSPNEPGIQINIDEKQVYDGDVPFTISVKDSENGGTYAGLKSVKWSVSNNETVTQSGNYNSEFSDPSARVQETVHQEKVLANKNNGNNIVITVDAEDYAGNRQITEKRISIDTTKPVINVSYDNNSAQNGKYFGAKRVMTVEIKERNFEPEKTFVNVTVNGQEQKYSIAELKGIGIAVEEERYDSEADVDSNHHTDSRINRYRFSFGADGKTDTDYQLSFSAEDTAGNSTSEAQYGSSVAGSDFVIDEIAPVMEYEFINSKNSKVSVPEVKDTPYYDTKSMNASIKITERNHSDGNLTIDLSGKNSKGNNVSGVSSKGTWSASGNLHTYAIEQFTADANYSISAKYKDLAGNQATLGERYFTVDGTAPSGVLATVYGTTKKTNSKLLDEIFFGSFYNRAISVQQIGSDETSGISQVAYYLYTPGKETRGTFKNLSRTALEQIKNENWKTWSGNLSIVPNRQLIVFLRVKDKAGNTTYINTKDGIIADDVAPGRPNIEIEEIANREVFSGDVSVRLSVADQEAGETYSGLKRVEWYVASDGVKTQSGNYNGELSDGAARKKSVSHEITVDAEKNNSNDVVIYVEAEDYAGNISKNSKRIAIDITKPTVSISYDDNSPRNGRYFNSARTMTITYTDRNFDPDKALINISINGVNRTFTAGNLSGEGIRLVQGRVDSQDGRLEHKYTDSRTNTYVYSFGAAGKTDADYEISASMADKAGNVSDGVNYGNSNPASSFTIDEIAPQLDMTFINGSGQNVNVSTNADNPYYDRQSMTAIVNVIERNFSGNGLEVSASGQNAIGKAVAAGVTGEWSGSNDTHHYRIKTYVNDGIYTIEATFTDLAGNTTTYKKHYFVVDKTAPTGSITISGQAGDGSTVRSVFEKFVDLVSFRIFTRKTMQIESASNDETSGIASVQYYLYVPDEEARGTFQGLTQSQLASVAWTNWNGPITISPNRQVIVYAKITDKAGNITYLNSRDGIVADDTAPEEPVITLKYAEGKKTVYGGDVPFTVTVTDPTRGGTYAGLKSVKWNIQKDGKVTQSGNFDSEFSDPTARRKSITKDLTVNAKDNNSNDVKIIVEAEDYAGNTSKSEQTLSVDITKPVIEVTYDRNDPQNDIYYDGTRVATIKVSERNFDPEKVKIDATEKEGAKAIVGKWSGNSTGSDKDVHTCTVTFKEDGDYVLTVSAEDVAGNKSDYERKDHFVVDTIKPVISVAYDENNKNGDIYFNKNRTAVIAVKDKNFNERDFGYKIDASLADKGVDSPKTGEWVHKGDVHSTMIVFEDDADYTFNLVCADLAGNMSKVFHQDKFVVDKTKPTIQFKNIENESANRGDVEPLIEYADINFNEGGVKIAVEGYNHEKVEAEGTAYVDGKSGKFQMDDFPHEQDVDDVYTVIVNITDLAGNVAKKSIQFSVNRFGSVYTFSEDTKAFLDQYYTKEPEVLTIYETNVDGLQNNGITIGHDGEATRLEEKKDYETEVDKDEHKWTVWTYKIKADNFSKEGLYEVKIESVDDAGNKQDNSLKDKPIAFAIDKTAPSVVMTGIDDSARYEETSKDVSIAVTDNIAVGDLSVLVNGEEKEKYSAEDIQKQQGKVTYVLEGADEWQSVEVVALDRAGNETKTGSVTVFVSNNKLRQFYENKPAFYGTIAGVAAGIAGLIFFLIAKKKKEQKSGKGKTKELDKPEGDSGSDELS